MKYFFVQDLPGIWHAIGSVGSLFLLFSERGKKEREAYNPEYVEFGYKHQFTVSNSWSLYRV